MALAEASSRRHLEDGLGGERRGQSQTQEDGDDRWIDLARRSFEASESFQSAYLQKGWAKSIDHFNSKHADGSRFRSPQYQGQIRLFRPKTRAMVNKSSAECARAFFSTQDVVNIAPENDGDQVQQASAETVNAILNHRLTRRLPWFLTLLGQHQTAQVMGVCVSKQYWRFEERLKETALEPITDPTTGQPVMDEATGYPQFTEKKTFETVKDDLIVEPHPPENLRIDPGADWRDPMTTSAFLILRIPMYAGTIRQRAKMQDPKTGQPQWREVDDSALSSAKVDSSAAIRQKRERYDRVDGIVGQTQKIEDHDLVWVHENVMRLDGEDHHYYTLGPDKMLSDVKPLREVYKHLNYEERPFTWGVGQLEAFRLYPESKVEMSADLQVKANYIDNFRLENVLQILHPKALVKAGSDIDMQALSSSRIGIVLKTPKPAEDVTFVRPPEVAGSAYQEQNAVNNDFDELTGHFSQSSVSTNRQLNETVGGMQMIQGAAGGVQDFELRLLTETWVEKTLDQCVRLIQMFESDPVVVAMAGRKAKVFQRYGLDPLTDDLLSGQLTTTVNVGIGSTNPEIKLGRFSGALKTVFGFLGPLVEKYGPGVIKSPGAEAIVKEIMGLAGYKDGERFLDFEAQGGQGGEPPELGQAKQAMEKMQAHIAELEQRLASKSGEQQTKLAAVRLHEEGETERTYMTIDAEDRARRDEHLMAAMRVLNGGGLAQAQPMGTA